MDFKNNLPMSPKFKDIIIGIIILLGIFGFLILSFWSVDNPINTENYQPDYYDTFGR